MMTDIENNIANVKTDIKLAVNRSLFLKGIITEEMYIKAKDMIIKAVSPCCNCEENTHLLLER